ncbi:MAG: DnaJ domain-containing protein [Actinomycetota bacterium]|nr:DnaJ domain-containing protein [Actinomycetota bacterium]
MTHYDVLGSTRDAPTEELKRAYYERARMFHPDAHASSSEAVRAEAERTMQALNSSWSVLRDAARRRRYDRSLDRIAPPPERVERVARVGRIDRRDTVVLAAGFQYWFASPGITQRQSGRRGLNLRVTGSSLAPLEALVPDGLVGLHAEGTTIDDVELRSLQAMRSLRFLDLTGTRVTDAGLVHLLGCHDLEVLSLWDTAISDDGLALLGRLPNLRQLGLGNTRVTDAGLRHLEGLHRLRLVQLTGTEIEGPGLRHLHGLPELASVTLPWRVRGSARRRLRSALPRTAVLL